MKTPQPVLPYWECTYFYEINNATSKRISLQYELQESQYLSPNRDKYAKVAIPNWAIRPDMTSTFIKKFYIFYKKNGILSPRNPDTLSFSNKLESHLGSIYLLSQYTAAIKVIVHKSFFTMRNTHAADLKVIWFLLLLI